MNQPVCTLILKQYREIQWMKWTSEKLTSGLVTTKLGYNMLKNKYGIMENG